MKRLFFIGIIFFGLVCLGTAQMPEASKLELLWSRSSATPPSNGIRERQNNLYTLALSPNGLELADVGRDGRLIFRDAKDGRPLRAYTPTGDTLYSVAWRPDGNAVAIGDVNGHLGIWSTTGKLIQNFEGHTYTVRRVAFSPNGKQLASGAWDSTARLWDVATGKETFRIQHKDFVNAIAYRFDGAVLITGSSDKTIQFTDPRNGKAFGSIQVPNPIFSLSWSAKGDYFATGDSEGIVRVYSSSSLSAFPTNRAYHEAVRDAMFTPNGQNLVSISQDGLVRLWNNTATDVFDVENPKGLYAFALEMTPDGTKIFVGCANGTIAAYALRK